MITDKLLTFCEGLEVSSSTQAANSDAVEIGRGAEVARTLNIVAQADDCPSATPTAATITPKLETAGSDGTYSALATYPAVTVADALAGKRLVNFAKLPLSGVKDKIRLSFTLSEEVTGLTVTAYLTPSAELGPGE